MSRRRIKFNNHTMRQPEDGALSFYTQHDKMTRMSIRMRHTSGHTGNRRSHHALKEMNILKNEDGTLRLPHRIDEATGMYRGKQIFTPKVKTKDTKKHAKGVNTTEVPHSSASVGKHAAETHANAETKSSKGIFGKIGIGGRPKARSGFGGGV